MILPKITTRLRSGFTLTELLVATGISAVVLTALMSAFLFSNRSFVAIGNYMDLNKASLVALDTMTRDIREARLLQSFATNRLVFTTFNNNQLIYAWDTSTRQLTRSLGGTTKVILKECDYLLFDISQRTPTTDGTFGFHSATNNAAICKLVSVSWRCTRSILGQKVNTESVQTARIVMRN